VVGVAETSYLLAIALGHKFSIMDPMREGLTLTRQLLLTYGFENFVASVRVLNLTVEEIWADKKRLKEVIITLRRTGQT